MGAKRVTIKEIADRAGVSTGTVSMVLNSNPLVADKTREHVQAIISELGYVYDRSAAQLRKGSTNIVGVSVCNLINPYFAEVVAGIDVSLNQVGKVLFLGNNDESEARQARFIESLREHNVEGLLLIPTIGTSKAYVERLIAWRLAVVMVTRYVPGIAVDYVGSNNHAGSLMATRHLLELGHQRIAFVGANHKTTTGRDRVLGYRAALRGAGIADLPAEFVIECLATREAGFSAVQQLLSLPQPPSAVVCFNDVLAFGVMLGLRKIGLEPGRDFSVVGADDVAEAALWLPSLTTVKINVSGIGLAAGELVRARIEDPDRKPVRVVLEPQLIVRESCGPYQPSSKRLNNLKAQR